MITLAVQDPHEPLMSDGSAAPIPVTVGHAVREHRGGTELVFHDTRHYFASLLIARGDDVKEVQARMLHAAATTTLNLYDHRRPHKDDRTRETMSSVFTARAVALEDPRPEPLADPLRTERMLSA